MSLLPALDKLPSKTAELAVLREQAGTFFRKSGLPTRKNLDWRYTSLKTLTEQPFQSSLATEVLPSHETLKKISQDLNPGFDHLVFINGRLDRTLSSVENLPAAVTWKAEVAGVDYQDAFEALSVATQGQGLTMQIPAHVEFQRPLQIHFVTASEQGPALMVNPRIKITVGANAKVTIIESYSSQDDAKSFQNSHTEIEIAEGASVTLLRMQEEGARAVHVGRTRIQLGMESQLTHLAYSTGGAISRHNLDVKIFGSGVQAQILGAVAGSGNQHFDQATSIDHIKGGSNSVQIYKALLDAESRSIFAGQIRIRRDAQKANSDQLNQNLLLSDKAEADSLPQMMIEADDVKATHGSTVGQLSEEELFYLCSRGLSRTQAIPLLAAGFLSSVLEMIPEMDVQAHVKSRLQRALVKLQLGKL